MACERAGAVGEPEARARRDAHDVGAVVPVVGHEGHPDRSAQPCERPGERQVGVSDDDALVAQPAQHGDAGLDRAVEPCARRPHDARVPGTGPRRDVGVVADHRDRQRRGRGKDVLGHDARETLSFTRCQCRSETDLGSVESLDRHENGHPIRLTRHARRSLG